MIAQANALQQSVEDLPPEDAVGNLVEHAAKLGVSDLFFASHEGHLMVQVRHLGILRPVTHLADEFGRRCLSYVKVMSNLDLAERRRPQDGRWIYTRPTGEK